MADGNQEQDIDLNPIPVDNDDTKQQDDDGDDFLVPLPVDETNNDDNDIEMKDTLPPQPQDTTSTTITTETTTTITTTDNTNTEEMIIEEEEEQGTIEEIVEEEEEEGGIVAPPQPSSEAKSASPPKPQPKDSAQATKTEQEEEDNRPRSHQITTDLSKPRYLNIHLMREWTNNEVIAWLTHRFGLWGQQYVPAFTNKKIDGAQLLALTENELKNEYGITKPLHLFRICRDIKDASRPIAQINRIIAPSYLDGGSAASKLMRFGPSELQKFAKSMPELKMYAQIFLDRQMNGRVLLECTYSQLVTAMKNESVTLVDAQSIIENYVEPIKNEEKINPETDSKKYKVITAINKIWDEMCKINERRFRLLPQHLRDYTKPAPTYQPPPQYYNQQQHYAQQQQQQHYPMQQHRGGRGDSETSGTPPLYQVKNVMQWGTEDCIAWLGTIKESKVDLRVRYTPHFEQIKMNGPTLLNMTPSTLSSICCITTKTHLKQIVKAIDKIRDHLIYTTFGQLEHVKEFTSKYGGGYNLPPQRAYQHPIQYQQRRPSRNAYDDSLHSQTKTVTQQQTTSAAAATAAATTTAQDSSSNKQQDQSATACFVCGATGNVMRCSQCKQAFYCSREHQVQDWAQHSKTCQK